MEIKIPKVLNKRTDIILPNSVYVGRPSKWGNPYKIGQKVNGLSISREETIGFYRSWLEAQVWQDSLDLTELKGKNLVCWCAPLLCHADVLLELANKEDK